MNYPIACELRHAVFVEHHAIFDKWRDGGMIREFAAAYVRTDDRSYSEPPIRRARRELRRFASCGVVLPMKGAHYAGHCLAGIWA